jgi:hypothetical protein
MWFSADPEDWHGHKVAAAPVRIAWFTTKGPSLKSWSVDGSRYRIVARVIWRAGEDAWPMNRRT